MENERFFKKTLVTIREERIKRTETRETGKSSSIMAHFGPPMPNKELGYKVHSTTLIYRRCLDFNPQPQNQVLDTYKLSKSSDLPPQWILGWLLHMWRHVRAVFTYVGPRQPK
jgi:hypothetical protein